MQGNTKIVLELSGIGNIYLLTNKLILFHWQACKRVLLKTFSSNTIFFKFLNIHVYTINQNFNSVTDSLNIKKSTNEIFIFDTYPYNLVNSSAVSLPFTVALVFY